MADNLAESKDADQISEESYLKGSGEQKMASSLKKPKTEADRFPKKVDRIREAIAYDFDNNGDIALAASLKA